MQHLLSHIANYYTLSKEAQEALCDCFTKQVLTKNEFLLKEGQRARHLYFLEKGALRGYYNADGKEITHWFGFENDFVTSFYSFTTLQPAVENIRLIEGCVLWSITKEQLAVLLKQYHEIETLVRIAYEKYYLRLEERYVNAQFKTATELYNNLLQQRPYILERAPLGYIASYLGISQETLSRIRSRH